MTPNHGEGTKHSIISRINWEVLKNIYRCSELLKYDQIKLSIIASFSEDPEKCFSPVHRLNQLDAD